MQSSAFSGTPPGSARSRNAPPQPDPQPHGMLACNVQLSKNKIIFPELTPHLPAQRELLKGRPGHQQRDVPRAEPWPACSGRAHEWPSEKAWLLGGVGRGVGRLVSRKETPSSPEPTTPCAPGTGRTSVTARRGVPVLGAEPGRKLTGARCVRGGHPRRAAHAGRGARQQLARRRRS